jgi:MFS family permease
MSADLGTGLKAYLRLLRYRPAAAPFLAATVARLPISMAPLGILLLVQSERDSYSLAGIVTGAFAVGSAIGTPLWGRAMDGFGQVRVLLPTAVVSTAFLVTLALATIGGLPIPALILFSLGAGLSFPPITPAMRAAWRTVFPDPRSRRVAFALDATSIELIFVGGPLLLSALLALTMPVVPLLVTAACMAIGGIAYCRTGAAQRSRPATPQPGDLPAEGAEAGPELRRHRSALTVPGVAAVLVVMLALSVGFGQLDTSMAGVAGELLGGTERVGLLFAAIAGGSAVGGLAFGSRTWSFDERRGVAVCLGTFAVFLVAISVLIALAGAPLGALLPLLFCTGLTIAPMLIMQQALLDHLTPAYRLNEAQSLLSAFNMVGAAAGTALAGIMIDFQGVAISFASASIAAGIAAVMAVLSQQHWRNAAAAAEKHHATADSSR